MTDLRTEVYFDWNRHKLILHVALIGGGKMYDYENECKDRNSPSMQEFALALKSIGERVLADEAKALRERAKGLEMMADQLEG